MHTFWLNGYQATSTEDLCAATGLGRSSIYNTFSSKHELFVRALKHYFRTATGRWLELLAEPLPAKEKVRRMLAQVIEDEALNPGRGCLAVNTVTELARRDESIRKFVRQDFDQLIDAIRVAIEAGQRDGEIDRGKDARSLAEFVHGTVGGLRLMSQSGAGRTAMSNVAEVALLAL